MRRSLVHFVIVSIVVALGALSKAAQAGVAPAPRVNEPMLQPLLDPASSMMAGRSDSHNLPQQTPVEPVPTPTAVSSGLVVLAAIAGVRIYRRIRLAA